MLVDRCLKLSARQAIEDILESGRTELAAYNVYGEADFRGMLNETFTPTRPYVFLVMSKMEPTDEAHLPFIVVQFGGIEYDPFELGNREGRTGPIWVHVIGETDGEATDIASYIAKKIKDDNGFAVKNHNDVVYYGYAPDMKMCQAEVIDTIRVEPTGEMAATLIKAALSYHWYTVSWRYRTLL